MKPDLISQRNKLYALMRQCLDDPSRLSEWERLAQEGDGFTREKSPRYQTALKEWLARSIPAGNFLKALAFSEILFQHGLFFDTHEYLEEAWNAESGERKLCLQGLIQIAAGFHKLELDSGAVVGALELLEKGVNKLQRSKSVLGESTVARIEHALVPALAALRRKQGAIKAPALKWFV